MLSIAIQRRILLSLKDYNDYRLRGELLVAYLIKSYFNINIDVNTTIVELHGKDNENVLFDRFVNHIRKSLPNCKLNGSNIELNGVKIISLYKDDDITFDVVGSITILPFLTLYEEYSDMYSDIDNCIKQDKIQIINNKKVCMYNKLLNVLIEDVERKKHLKESLRYLSIINSILVNHNL